MTRHSSISQRCAATLVELVMAMAAGSALLAGMASTVYVAVRAASPNNTPAVALIETAACIADFAAEFQYATAINELTATSAAITVPDRNGDSTVETIRYVWTSGGQAFTRQYNGGSAAVLLPGIQAIALEFFPSYVAPDYVTFRIQRTADAASTVEISFPMLNL